MYTNNPDSNHYPYSIKEERSISSLHGKHDSHRNSMAIGKGIKILSKPLRIIQRKKCIYSSHTMSIYDVQS